MSTLYPEIIQCGICGSDHIEEVERDLFYSYRCTTCDHQSEETMIQNMAPTLWNEDPINKDFSGDLKLRIRGLEDEIYNHKHAIEDIEDEIRCCNREISHLKDEIRLAVPAKTHGSSNKNQLACA